MPNNRWQRLTKQPQPPAFAFIMEIMDFPVYILLFLFLLPSDIYENGRNFTPYCAPTKWTSVAEGLTGDKQWQSPLWPSLIASNYASVPLLSIYWKTFNIDISRALEDRSSEKWSLVYIDTWGRLKKLRMLPIEAYKKKETSKKVITFGNMLSVATETTNL